MELALCRASTTSTTCLGDRPERGKHGGHEDPSLPPWLGVSPPRRQGHHVTTMARGRHACTGDASVLLPVPCAARVLCHVSCFNVSAGCHFRAPRKVRFTYLVCSEEILSYAYAWFTMDHAPWPFSAPRRTRSELSLSSLSRVSLRCLSCHSRHAAAVTRACGRVYYTFAFAHTLWASATGQDGSRGVRDGR